MGPDTPRPEWLQRTLICAMALVGLITLVLIMIVLFAPLTPPGPAPQGISSSPAPSVSGSPAPSASPVTATPSTGPSASASSVASPSASASASASPSASAAPSPGTFGAFDQTLNIPLYSRVLVALIVLIVGGVLELFLTILYAAFFINHPEYHGESLGLAPATVRVFIVCVIVLVIVLFAIFPDQWGSSKAVVLLFGLLSTIIGFYFGARGTAGTAPGGAARTVKFTVAAQTISKANFPAGQPITITGTMAANYRAVLGMPAPVLYAIMIDGQGNPVGSSQKAPVDAAGKAQFDFDAALRRAANGTYVVRMLSPTSVTCEDAITLTD